MYTFAWTNVTHEIEKEDVSASRTDELACPMREDPLHLIPAEQRSELLEKLMRSGPHPQLSACRSKAIFAPRAGRCIANSPGATKATGSR